MALGLGSLLAFRRDRVWLAAVFASLAVTVRPLTIFMLVGIGLVLLYRRGFGPFWLQSQSDLQLGFCTHCHWRVILATHYSRCTRIRIGTTAEAA